VPVFVLTNHARDPLPMKGGTTFTFVTEGIEAALQQARQAAGDKDVTIAGGARLLDNLGSDLTLTPIRTVEAPGVTHVKYRCVG
jgi:dihydrofolate reductase